MTLQQVAKHLGKSEHTIRRYVQQGKIEATLIEGKYDITEEALYQYLDDYPDARVGYPNEQLAKKEKEIEELRSQLIKLQDEMIKLQNEMIEERRREDEARQRSDMIIAHLTRQLEQQNRLLEYHQEPWWRRWFQKGKQRQATLDFSTNAT